jgi:peptide/nickel transport system permease protein
MTTSAPLAPAVPVHHAETPVQRRPSLRRFVRHRPALIGAFVLVGIILIAVFADSIGRVSPVSIDLRAARTGPSPAHPLGADLVGRDVWSRLVHAAQVSLEVGIGAVSVYVAIGIVLGALAGWYQGVVATVILRLADMVLSFPLLILVLVVVALVGPSLSNIILILGLLGWPAVARLVRGQFLSVREMEFVQAARALGASNARLIIHHVMPNTVGVVLVAATFGVANAILIEASLSFLGMGVQPPTPSWGNMLNDAQSLPALESMPWLWVPPGVMILLTILSINFLGDGLRDALDPRVRPGQ